MWGNYTQFSTLQQPVYETEDDKEHSSSLYINFVWTILVFLSLLNNETEQYSISAVLCCWSLSVKMISLNKSQQN